MLNPKNLARSSVALKTAQRGFAAAIPPIDQNLTDFDIVFVGKYRHLACPSAVYPGRALLSLAARRTLLLI